MTKLTMSVAVLALVCAAAVAHADDSTQANTEHKHRHWVNPPTPCPKCACPAGYGGVGCAECPVGTWSAGGVAATCVPCGQGLTTLVPGSTSAASCVSAACAARGFRGVSIPADGSAFTDVVTPPSCFNFTLDATTESCFGGSVGDSIINPAVAYYIAPSPTARNITITTCITMSHDPASVQYSVDPGIVVFASDASCGISSDALLCADDWETTAQANGYDEAIVGAICEDGNSDYGAFTFATLAPNTAYLVVNNYYDDMSAYCNSDTVITTPLTTTFWLNSQSRFAAGFKNSRGTAATKPRLTPAARLEKNLAALKAKAARKAKTGKQ